jgi:PAS domain S-box-containing protein
MEHAIASPADPQPHRFFWNPRMVPIVGLAGLVLSLAGAFLTRQILNQRTAHRFASEVAVVQGELAERVRSYADIMSGVRGLAQASGGMTQKLLHDYLATMELENQYRGLLAVTFGFPLAQAQRGAFEARLREELGPEGFAIQPPGTRPRYFVVAYGEPPEANGTTIGFDTLSMPGQAASLDLAVASGHLVASAPMKARQYDGPDPCLVLRLAVYRPGLPAATPEQRRLSVYGVINGVFRAQDLIQAALGMATRSRMKVWIEDVGAAQAGTQASVPVFLYGEPFAPQASWSDRLWSPPQIERTHTVGGRIWRLHFRAHPARADLLDWLLPLGVLAAGLAVTFLLSRMLSSLNQTERRARTLASRMTEELQQNEARLQAIAQAVPDLLFVLDEDGRYVEVHGGQEDLLAAPRPELLGRSVTEVLPPEVAQLCLDSLGQALASHSLQTIGYGLATPSGLKTFEGRLMEMGTRMNGKRCVVILTRDITERVRAEENLRMTQKLESLGVLAGGIAHDFNNLLTAILGNLNLAQVRVGPEAAAAPYLHRVETAVLRAAELAHQMLAYSGRGTFTVSLQDLNQLVGEMTELLSVSISKNVQLRFDLAPDLPPILADAIQVQQVVMNLVTNASEAMAEGAGTISVATGLVHLDLAHLGTFHPTQALAPGRYVTLTVVDTGCGMDAPTLDRIFDPFFTTKSTGRGLGLSAMLGILRGHGAGIAIASVPGGGSTFRVCFPAAAPKESVPQPALALHEAIRDLQGTILVVDDEATLRATVANLLDTLGLQVVEAADGVEALERLADPAHPIDLVLMDITMPRMDGNQAFLELRKQDPDLPVILCSGFTIQEMAAPPAGTRPAAFLQKPYRLRELQGALQRALQGRPGTGGGL